MQGLLGFSSDKRESGTGESPVASILSVLFAACARGCVAGSCDNCLEATRRGIAHRVSGPEFLPAMFQKTYVFPSSKEREKSVKKSRKREKHYT